MGWVPHDIFFASGQNNSYLTKDKKSYVSYGNSQQQCWCWRYAAHSIKLNNTTLLCLESPSFQHGRNYILKRVIIILYMQFLPSRQSSHSITPVCLGIQRTAYIKAERKSFSSKKTSILEHADLAHRRGIDSLKTTSIITQRESNVNKGNQ